ncbi:sugar kinase [Cypionkella aquatica]|uniref:Sugar kinase n=1 Tax=Cypionkella aquatica TaxID=1756042 RepID=A0AA37WZ06_9RHOB|nr:carbohydrate kinase family protein [Cypionkella aquatica]GLS85219.1 sugar kinase [Cypionkella aquatica]
MTTLAPRQGIACAGNWIVDIVHSIDAWPQKSELVRIRHEATGVGGGAANVILDLAAFQTGLPLYAVGLIGTDTHADLCLAACKAAKVDTRWLKQTATHPTAHTQVMNVPGDSRTFFYHPGANDALAESDIPVEAIAAENAKIFYLGYPNLLATLDAVEPDGETPAARLLSRARAAGMITCVDLVSAANADFAATVKATLPHADYLFLNEIEAARATNRADIAPDDRARLLEAATALQAAGAKTVILHTGTLALWLEDAALWSSPDPVDPAEILSPVGAGDAFCAGAIYAIHQGQGPAQALRLGHKAAAASLKGATATDGIPPLAVLNL